MDATVRVLIAAIALAVPVRKIMSLLTCLLFNVSPFRSFLRTWRFSTPTNHIQPIIRGTEWLLLRLSYGTSLVKGVPDKQLLDDRVH